MADDGYTSSDPAVKARIAQMMQQTIATSSQGTSRQTATGTVYSAPKDPATGKTFEYSVPTDSSRNTSLNTGGRTTSTTPGAGTGPNYPASPTNPTGYGGFEAPEMSRGTPKTEATIAPPPVPTYSPTTAVSSTDQIRATTESNQTSAKSVLSDVNAFQDTIAGQNALADLKSKQAALNGPLTPEQEASVKASVDEAQANYDRLIADAQNAKDQGMAKNLVNAGQQGGLMNTQFSGLAALMPVKGGTFVGLGGELNRMQSEYDKQITVLKIEQTAAMESARVAATKAIRTGEQTDLDNAFKMFGIAQDLNDEHNKVAIEKEKATLDMQDRLKKDQQDIFTTIVNSGIDEASLPQGYFEAMDVNLGVPLGTSQALFTHTKADKATQDFNDQLKVDSQIADLQKSGALASMDDAALAQLAKSGGFDLAGLKTLRATAAKPGDIQWDLQKDVDGNQVAVRFDPATGTYESKMIQRKAASGGGSGGSDKRAADLQTDAQKLIERIDDPTDVMTWETARDQLLAGYSEAPPELIEKMLGGSSQTNTALPTGRGAPKSMRMKDAYKPE